MSQVFAGDAVNQLVTGTITGTGETPIVMGNFLNPPFQNAKAVVLATVWFTPGTGTTYVGLRLRRNPSGENLVIGNTANYAVTAGNNTVVTLQYADSIPDGRPVQYQLTVQQTGASGNGTLYSGSIAAFLISG